MSPPKPPDTTEAGFLPPHTRATPQTPATQCVGETRHAGEITWASDSGLEAVFRRTGAALGVRVSLRRDGYYRPCKEPIGKEENRILLGKAEGAPA